MYEIYCKLRDEKGYKDSDVARITGITKSTFSDWKSGRSTPKQDKLQRIAECLNVSLDYLMTGLEAVRDPTAFNPLHRRANGEEGLQAILADIYGCCKDVEINGEYFTCHYYSIGTGKAQYALHDVEFERLYASVKQIITQMTDVIKKNEIIVRHECQKSADEPPSAEIYADFRKNGDIIPELEKKYGYIQDNVESGYLMPQTAHKRTDIEVTDEMQKHDNITHEDKSCCTIVPSPHFKTVGEARKFLKSREHLAAWKTDGLSDEDIITMANSILSNGD